MTRDEAKQLITDFFARFGKTTTVFDDADFVKANIGEAVLGFEFRADEQILACYALIYQFHEPPRPEILREIKFAENEWADTGVGETIFDDARQTLSLVRFYDEIIDSPTFSADMQKLAAASLLWSETVLDRIATRVFGH